jgi:hypothetical protein
LPLNIILSIIRGIVSIDDVQRFRLPLLLVPLSAQVEVLALVLVKEAIEINVTFPCTSESCACALWELWA